MVKVASIWMERDEGRVSECGKPKMLPTFAAANWLLSQWAESAPSTGYHKVRFVVTYEDGEQYEGRFDLKKEHRFGARIAKHMVDYLSFYAGCAQPARISQDEYERFITARGDKREACVLFLATYELMA